MSVRFETKHAETEAKIRAACAKSLREAGMLIETRAKQLCPVDTGNLRRTITSKVNIVSLEAEISANADYAPYLEYGTRHMRPQPYMRPAGDKSRNDVTNIFRRNLMAVK